MKIPGHFFDGKTTHAQQASISFIGGKVELVTPSGAQFFERGQVKVLSRLGTAPWAIEFPGLARFETTAFDLMEQALGGAHRSSDPLNEGAAGDGGATLFRLAHNVSPHRFSWARKHVLP